MSIRQDLFESLFRGETLSYKKTFATLQKIAANKYNPCQVSAFLTAYRMRRITVDELEGFRDAMLELALRVDLKDYNPIDLCGTGGDGKNTFNISTISAFVVAGCGVKVAKHGNYGVSSRCGSSNVLESLGIQFTNKQDKLQKLLDKAGIVYLHAPLFHPAMKNVAPIRKDLGFRTFFNLLGPLINPCVPTRQLIGVSSLEIARLYSYLLQRKDIRYAVVHSLDGYDEISLTGSFKTITNGGEQIHQPQDIQMRTVSAESLKGGINIEENAELFQLILAGKGNDNQNQVIAANAAFALQCVFPNKSLIECIEMAKESLVSGKANKALNTLIELS